MKYLTAALLAASTVCAAREHAETSIVLHLPGPPAEAFPLFGPVREAEWSPHWTPAFLYPAGGAQATGAVFTTGSGVAERIWILSLYDEKALQISYSIFCAGQYVTKLDISLKPEPRGTEATVTYRNTSLSEAGDRYVREFARDFPGQREHWEHAIGARLRELHGAR
jgi:hypothetical protein